MKTKLTITRNGKDFSVEVETSESGKGILTMGENKVPCQLTKNTMDQVNWSIWKNIICEVSNLTDNHGNVVVENGKSVLRIEVVKMY